ncbi:hypothetical protein [Methylosinus sp. Ce-a6]|uniref:hypothetical protein n=1 Tax=Methylosinus sp. Ce-a6 TaxID=2172005 RepID=UPI001FCEF5D1|nr:hypothetical protein [Methylosinus sp. Ce-a6]
MSERLGVKSLDEDAAMILEPIGFEKEAVGKELLDDFHRAPQKLTPRNVSI